MKFLRNIENGAINIKRMGIIKGFLVVLLSILLEVLGQVPVEIKNLFSGRFEKALPYVIFAFGVIFKYYVVIILLKCLSNSRNEQKLKYHLNPMSFLFTAIMIIAFRLVFDNSLTLWVSRISMPDFINGAFEELTVSPIILILSSAVVAPIYEEIIFRGILLKGMAKKINPIIALVVSALFFAVVHLNVPQGINAFLLGLVIGFIYLTTGSIYLSIFAHFINNLLALSVSSRFALIGGEHALGIHGVLFILGVVLLVIACIGYQQNKIRKVPDIYIINS
ncbi:CPBP family intramembrane glutamic endopeptidase [Clostridium tagluense]|uniref:CAAX prenyl protease 2/Lysostaphin resistance protein A-like domain-containing protein n=1 Tax=Clostridium tagluense TaxID=360422 RepID=A0A401UG82_9CLOT|nr:type II CAAX endopeptidase family protein [Clostridium tagluense]GCD08489.1 hypothetical protein Ctaglu_01120 [Clostridium tagluense]